MNSATFTSSASFHSFFFNGYMGQFHKVYRTVSFSDVDFGIIFWINPLDNMPEVTYA